MKSLTDDMDDLGIMLSNLDHTIEEGTAEKLKAADGKAFCGYAGWNFNARVWWRNGRFWCEVWTYGAPRNTVDADTLEEIMTEVSDQYGYS